MEINKVYCGNSLDVLKTFPDESINMVMTSPPYWNLRNYNVENQQGTRASEYAKLNGCKADRKMLLNPNLLVPKSNGNKREEGEWFDIKRIKIKDSKVKLLDSTFNGAEDSGETKPNSW